MQWQNLTKRVGESEEEIKNLTKQLADANRRQQLIKQDMANITTTLGTLTTQIGELDSKIDTGE